jgi:predicted negative regulator of RcsB-dependent stress response
MEKPTYRRKQMEFLIVAAVLLVAGYLGYQYYLAKQAAPTTYDLPLSAEVEVAPVEAAAEKPKKPAAKKKPTMKIVK